VQQSFGICQCEAITTVEQLCNIECREKLPKTTFTSDGLINIYDPVTNSTILTELNATYGVPKCSKEDPTECKLTGLRMVNDPRGNFAADFNLPEAVIGGANKDLIAQRFSNMKFDGERTYVNPPQTNEDPDNL